MFYLAVYNPAKAQAPGMLELEGRTVKDGKPLSGAKVSVYRGGTTEMVVVKTGKNGKFQLSLPFGTDYKVTFSYLGCVDMHLLVYTGKLPKEKNNIFPLYVTEVPFFENTNSTVRLNKYKNPFTKIIYDGRNNFTWVIDINNASETEWMQKTNLSDITLHNECEKRSCLFFITWEYKLPR